MSAENSAPPLPPNVKVLGGASLLNDIASEMVYPLLSEFVIHELGGSRVHVGAIEGAAESASALLKLGSGAWSDRLRRRKGLVVAGYAIAAFIRPLVAFVTMPWQLLLARLGDRTGKGIRTAPRDALIADSTLAPYRGRAFGFHRAMDHLGAAIGPLLAALFLWLWPNELRVLFLCALVPGLLVLVLLIFGLREPPRRQPAKTAAPALSLAPFDARFRIFLVALLIFTLGNSSDLFLLTRAGELGVPRAALPILWTVFHIAKSSGNLVTGPLVDKLGPRLLLFLGWLWYAAVYLAFAVACEAWHVWALFLAYAGFYALTEPAEKTLIANLAGPDNKGLAFGWFNLTLGIASLPASLIFGWLYDEHGALVAFGWGATLALVAALLLWGVREKPTHGRKTP